MNIVQKVKAGFSLILLFPQGMKAFSGTKKDALISFAIPVLGMGPGLAVALSYPPRGLHEGFDISTNTVILLTQAFLALGLSVLYAMGCAWLLKRKDEIWLFFEAVNWTVIAYFTITLPVFILAMQDIFPRDEADRALMIMDLYSYVVVGYIAYRSLNINWYFAGFVACMMILSGQHAWQFVFALWDIPYPWNY